MDAETRLNKRIEIAARIAAALVSGDKEPENGNATAGWIGNFCLGVADAIITGAEKTN